MNLYRVGELKDLDLTNVWNVFTLKVKSKWNDAEWQFNLSESSQGVLITLCDPSCCVGMSSVWQTVTVTCGISELHTAYVYCSGSSFSYPAVLGVSCLSSVVTQPDNGLKSLGHINKWNSRRCKADGCAENSSLNSCDSSWKDHIQTDRAWHSASSEEVEVEATTRI